MWHLETQNTETQSPQQFPNWRIVAEAFDLDHFPNKRDRISERVNEFFWEKDIISRDIDSAHNNTDTNFIEITIWEEIYYFDIYSEQYCGMSLDEANAFREAHPNPEIQVMLEWIPLLEQVMENNSWYLNSDDIIDFDAPEAFSWMTARELQMTIRWNIRTFHKNWGLLWIDDTQKEKIVWLYQIYLEIIMGIGDTFEDGSDEFHKTDGEIDIIFKPKYMKIEADLKKIKKLVRYFLKNSEGLYLRDFKESLMKRKILKINNELYKTVLLL